MPARRAVAASPAVGKDTRRVPTLHYPTEGGKLRHREVMGGVNERDQRAKVKVVQQQYSFSDM